MPAQRKSKKMKQLQNTYRPDRDSKSAPVGTGELGTAPGHFNDDEKRAWSEISDTLQPGIACQSDRITFEILIKLLVKFRADAASSTEATLLVRTLGKFGLSPSERANVIPLPAPKKKSKWLK